VVELDQCGEQRNGDVQNILKKLSGFGTVPQVFVGGKCIGGGSETRRALADGKLVPMMEKAGAVFSKK